METPKFEKKSEKLIRQMQKSPESPEIVICSDDEFISGGARGARGPGVEAREPGGGGRARAPLLL